MQRLYRKLLVDLEMASVTNLSNTLVDLFPLYFKRSSLFPDDESLDERNVFRNRETVIYWGLKLIVLPIIRRISGYVLIFIAIKNRIDEPDPAVDLDMDEEDAFELRNFFPTAEGKSVLFGDSDSDDSGFIGRKRGR